MAKNFKKFITLWVKELPKQVGMNTNNGAKVEILPVPVWINVDEIVCVQKMALFKCDEDSDARKYLTKHNIKDLYMLSGKGFNLANVVGPLGNGEDYFDAILQPTI